MVKISMLLKNPAASLVSGLFMFIVGSCLFFSATIQSHVLAVEVDLASSLGFLVLTGVGLTYLVLTLVSSAMVGNALVALFTTQDDDVMVPLGAMCLGFAMGLSMWAFFPLGQHVRHVGGAVEALHQVRRAEDTLGRAIPAGDRVRASMASLEKLEANMRYIKGIATARVDADGVTQVLALSSVLGNDHPVIRFASDNGMVRASDRVALYRDLVERVRADRSVASNPAVMAALASR